MHDLLCSCTVQCTFFNLLVTKKKRNLKFTNLKLCKKAREPFKPIFDSVLFLIYYLEKHFKGLKSISKHFKFVNWWIHGFIFLMSPTGYMYFIAIVSISPFKLFQCDLLETDWNKFRIKSFVKYQTWNSTIEKKSVGKIQFDIFWYFLVKPSACELRVAQYEKPLTKGHCPIKQRDQNSAKDPDKIAKKRSERRERSHLLKEKIIKLIEGGLQLSEYQARKVKELSFS